MLKEINLEQGSQAWLDWRKTGIGSSDAPAILDMSPWMSRKHLWEQKVLEYHKSKKVFTAEQMSIIVDKMRKKEMQNESAKNRGKKLEDPCRKLYEDFIGYKVDPICGTDSDYEFLKVSLDGYNKEKDLFVEIKCPNNKSHDVAIGGNVPDYYVPQLLHQFNVSKCKTCHYISYHDKYPPGQNIIIIEVNKDTSRRTLNLEPSLDELIEFMHLKTVEFWDMVVSAEWKE
jgi:putative phage-type endonuclease